eukprot:10800345-Alexandrium_andersonii.AAC.1
MVWQAVRRRLDAEAGNIATWALLQARELLGRTAQAENRARGGLRPPGERNRRGVAAVFMRS